MSQEVAEQNWKDFLIEHYRQVNQHLRDSDRNRNVMVQIYFVVFIAMLNFPYSGVTHGLEIVVPGAVFVLGFFVSHYITYARAWHCEYTRVAKAIHKSFLNTDLRLYDAARQIKEEEERKRRTYFNPRGTEFIVAVLVWLSMAVETYLLFRLLHDSICLQWPAVILLITTVGLLGSSIWWYKSHLDKRECKFPDDCWCIFAENQRKNGQE